MYGPILIAKADFNSKTRTKNKNIKSKSIKIYFCFYIYKTHNIYNKYWLFNLYNNKISPVKKKMFKSIYNMRACFPSQIFYIAGINSSPKIKLLYTNQYGYFYIWYLIFDSRMKGFCRFIKLIKRKIFDAFQINPLLMNYYLYLYIICKYIAQYYLYIKSINPNLNFRRILWWISHI